MISIGDILEYNSRYFGSKTAIISGEMRLTYKELNKRVDQLAWGLSILGLEKDDVCSLLLPNCHEFLECYFAISKIGAVANPLNYRLSETEVKRILSHGNPNILIVDPLFIDRFSADFLYKLADIRVIVIGEKSIPGFLNYEELLERSRGKTFETRTSSRDNNLLIYTSGTTGFPKGALITNNHIVWNSFNTTFFFRLTERDVTLSTAPFFHIAGLHDFVFPHLHVGGAVVLQRKFNPYEIADLIEKHQITNMFLIPTMYEMLIEAFSGSSFKKYPSLRMISSGAAPISKALCDEIRGKVHDNFLYGYGLSEAGPNVCFCDYSRFPDKGNSIGLPLPHQSMALIDENFDEVVESGAVGEIVIDGPTVFAGYFKDFEATSEVKRLLKIRNKEAEWLLTGDLAYKDDEGLYYIVDRKKDIIITGGENVYCIEVENVLNSHPDVKESAVIGIGDDKWGEVVKAYIVPKYERKVSFEELTKYCREYLGGYKIPRIFEITNSIPRNPSGKILRRELKAKMHHH